MMYNMLDVTILLRYDKLMIYYSNTQTHVSCLREWVINKCHHKDVIKCNHFPRYWPFVRGIHRSPVNSPHKGQWRGALMFSLICARINCWVNNLEVDNLRRHLADYDVTVMIFLLLLLQVSSVYRRIHFICVYKVTQACDLFQAFANRDCLRRERWYVMHLLSYAPYDYFSMP